MTVELGGAADLTPDVVRRVAWQGEGLTLAPSAVAGVGRRRAEFVMFVEAHRGRHLYGITTRHHHGAKQVLDADARAEYARRLPSTPASTGPGLPERVVRAVVLARLADVLNGTAAVRPETATALAAMLDGPMPYVPERGHGEPGNIIALGHLFRSRFDGTLEIGEGMALINGAPVSAAVLTDAVLAGRGRITVAEDVVALAAVAARAPAEHYDEELARAWGDEHQAATLARMRDLMTGVTGPPLAYQAPVSFRSAPRVLGWTRRALARAEDDARISLSASSNNPIFVGPGVRPPLGEVLSNGGYHNPLAAPGLDSLARSWADLAQLVTAQVSRLVAAPDGIVAAEPEAQVSLLDMTSSGWAEEARAAAGPSLIGLGPGGQTDTTTSEMLAWRRACDAGAALDAALAVLAVVAAHTVGHRDETVPPGLRPLADAVASGFPLGTGPVAFGTGLDRVRAHLARRVFPEGS
ncbi:aromatic amino acid lyase [Pseudonocardia sp. KRD291]|uniref:aromatic amino acid lyase n=1 Tax=Pseudonocardia sp. KRD291 TaxID=2792007 RepID=UPI001C4A7085|nr:aromatic amino acid lyase [Pseudonocardia sp. KRD291]MBW0106515.1 aromatic amino acid lyase [Pseudonocardia sp. KRD291]